MTVDKKWRSKLTQRQRAIWLTALLMLIVVPPVATGTGPARVKKAVTNHGFQRAVVKPDKPINCENFMAHLDHAIIDWMDLKGTHLIFIARLGTGERDHDLSRARLEYVEDYLKRKGVQYVLAEGSHVDGFGRFEAYVGGRLYMSIPVQKNTIRLCHGGTGE
jgi:hypothetical protein